jgi:HK97 family phage prohead protease
MKLERRTINAPDLTINQTEGTDTEAGLKIRGHAAVFNQLSSNLGGFVEKIMPGAFLESIAKDDIRALWNHDDCMVLGRNTAGTLTLAEDEIGLYVEITPPDTTAGRDALTSIQRRDVTQMSFMFSVPEDGDLWEEIGYQQYVRTIVKATLYEVSPVTFPAYPQTDVDARSLIATAKDAGKIVSASPMTLRKYQLALLEMTR